LGGFLADSFGNDCLHGNSMPSECAYHISNTCEEFHLVLRTGVLHPRSLHHHKNAKPKQISRPVLIQYIKTS
jgi:hypothetical protein